MRSSPFNPEPVDVFLSDNVPIRVHFKRKMQNVQEITNIWRVDDSWWSKPASRMYYTLELDGSGRITVFHDLLNNKWYKQNWAA
jgi:hypothetical protein